MHKQNNEVSLRKRREVIDLDIPAVLPVEHQDHFSQTEAKHFGEATTGSQFTDEQVKSLRDLLNKAAQEGGLDRDDRKQFEESGVQAGALLNFCRYLKVEGVKGKAGIIAASELDPKTKVLVKRIKSEAPCALIVSGQEWSEVNFATIIIGPNRPTEDNPRPSTAEMVWTAHPGLPIRPATSDTWEDGSEITIAEVMQKLGNDVYIQVES